MSKREDLVLAALKARTRHIEWRITVGDDDVLVQASTISLSECVGWTPTCAVSVMKENVAGVHPDETAEVIVDAVLPALARGIFLSEYSYES